VRREALDPPFGSGLAIACLSEGGAKRRLREVTTHAGQANFYDASRHASRILQIPGRASVAATVKYASDREPAPGSGSSTLPARLYPDGARNWPIPSRDPLSIARWQNAPVPCRRITLRLRVERPGDDRRRGHPSSAILEPRATLAERRKDRPVVTPPRGSCTPSPTGAGFSAAESGWWSIPRWIGVLRRGVATLTRAINRGHGTPELLNKGRKMSAHCSAYHGCSQKRITVRIFPCLLRLIRRRHSIAKRFHCLLRRCPTTLRQKVFRTALAMPARLSRRLGRERTSRCVLMEVKRASGDCGSPGRIRVEVCREIA
jgi:hypothetical protein